MTSRSRKTQLWLGLGGLLVALLLAAVFTLGSLDLPFEPRQWREVLDLFAVSVFIFSALLVFGLVLIRSLVRLWIERRAAQLGSRFKTKMVLGAMAISLLPVVFLFFVSYALLNRTLGRWFPRPLEIASEEGQKLLGDLGRVQHERLDEIARQAALGVVPGRRARARTGAGRKIHSRAYDALFVGADAAWTLDAAGNPHDAWAIAAVKPKPDGRRELQFAQPAPRFVRTLHSGAELWEAGGVYYLAGRAPLGSGALIVGRRLPDDFLRRYSEIETQTLAYGNQKQQYRAYKRSLLLVFFLFTLLLLFAVTWFAVFLSKQVTLPIQALAEGTREVTAGNFDYRVDVLAQDELGQLVRSFNQMTAQLGDSSRQIEESTRNLQQAVQELDRRRKLMEAILENIPTGVLSLDGSGAIVRLNPAMATIFGVTSRDAHSLETLAGEEAARGIQQLMRRSLRMGTASKELEIALPGRVVHAAVTVSSLGPRRSNPGFVVVVDDLTELLRAQKASAWQEVAQRIAHEIKNPLTPIQLSAQRLMRHVARPRAAAAPGGITVPAQETELARLVSECAGLIEREVATLESLVGEFSEFARFPTARLVAADANTIVSSALEVFQGRLDGITVRSHLAAALPPVKADPELLRRVLVNLIDNAAEAMEGASRRQLALSTRLEADGETVEIAVADSGHGISPEDKDQLFLPHFSTKDRGTGLGLAIAGRIIAEHHGTIRVEDNTPIGARFVIQVPVAEVAATSLPSDA